MVQPGALYLNEPFFKKKTDIGSFPRNPNTAKNAKNAITQDASGCSISKYAKTISLASCIEISILNFLLVDDYEKNISQLFRLVGVLILRSCQKMLLILTHLDIQLLISSTTPVYSSWKCVHQLEENLAKIQHFMASVTERKRRFFRHPLWKIQRIFFSQLSTFCSDLNVSPPILMDFSDFHTNNFINF